MNKLFKYLRSRVGRNRRGRRNTTSKGYRGNDCTLFDNGQLLALLKDLAAEITFSGYGGIIRILNKKSSVAKEIKFSSENELVHDDIEMLPNGNLLFLVWEKTTAATALENGYNTGDFEYGSDLLYRFGYPTTYQNTNGARIIHNIRKPK